MKIIYEEQNDAARKPDEVAGWLEVQVLKELVSPGLIRTLAPEYIIVMSGDARFVATGVQYTVVRTGRDAAVIRQAIAMFDEHQRAVLVALLGVGGPTTPN